jgi:hypothetical protein
MRRSNLKLGLAFAMFLAGLVLIIPHSALAEDVIRVTNQVWEANFRDHVTFTLSAESTAEIVDVELIYRIVGQPASFRNQADFVSGTSIEAEYVIDQTVPGNYLPPGTELEYWWNIVDADGNELKTEKEVLIYLDNRYDWQTLENERLSLYWYAGDDSFGQALFDRANVALDTLETDVGIGVEDSIKIFIYGNHSDFLGAIATSAQEWTGGQAFTRFGVVVMGVSPNQLRWGLNATTHEMTHLVIHQATENPFGDLPRWLDEGVAVYNENRDELDRDFRPVFEWAVENDELMTLRSLSSPFPADPLQANLAYGESGAVVKFIIDTYGAEAMAELLEIFSEGALYDEALEQALGVDTDGLYNAFRASLNLPPLSVAEDDNTVEASQEDVIVAESEEAAKSNPEENVDEEVPQQVTKPLDEPAEADAAEVSTPPEAAVQSPVEAEEPASTGVPFGLACLASLIPLVIIFALNIQTLKR